MQETKTCNSCGVFKPATSEYFMVAKKRKGGISNLCKECRNARVRLSLDSSRVSTERGCFPDRKFNMLTSVSFDRRQSKNAYWLFRCDCGNEKVINYKSVKTGSTKSCGCRREELIRDKATTHGLCYHSAYPAWINLMARCYRESHPEYKRYGAKGIKVCDAWKDNPVAFVEYMGEKPSPEHSIDRINYLGDYEPGNVWWATAKQQAMNTSNHTRRSVAIDVGEYTPQQLTDWETDSTIQSRITSVFAGNVPAGMVLLGPLDNTTLVFNHLK